MYLFLVLIFCFNSVFAQVEELSNGLLFPKFEKGIVVFKNGSRSATSLNYSTFEEEMLFQNADSTIMVIANPSDILVVIIGERRFIPTSSKCIFYEEIQAGTGSFFVQHKATMISDGKAAAYGGYSSTSAITSFGSYSEGGSGRVVKLNPDVKYRIKYNYSFYVKSGKNYKRFMSAKSLGKLFKGQESKIEAFAKENSIDFSKIDDIASIVEYAYSMVNK